MDEVRYDGKNAGAIMADSEPLILVDEADCGVGHMSKTLCHEGQGVLHRAFSLLIFNERGELLIQQRAACKRLWPLYWSNSCCSHPTALRRPWKRPRGAAPPRGARPRMRSSIPVQVPVSGAVRRRRRGAGIVLGLHRPLHAASARRSAARSSTGAGSARMALQAELAGPMRSSFTPWFLMEWERIWRDHRAAVLALHRPQGLA